MDNNNKKTIDNEELSFEHQVESDPGLDFSKPEHTLGQLEQN